MRSQALTTASLEAPALDHYAGELPPRVVEMRTSVFGDGGVILERGTQYTVRGEFAAQLIGSRQAFDPISGEGRPVPKTAPAKPERSGKTVRIRILPGHSVLIDGQHYDAGVHDIPREVFYPARDVRASFDPPNLLAMINAGCGVRKAELADAPSPLPVRRRAFGGEPHKIRILGQPVADSNFGIYSAALDRHVALGEEVTVNDSEATILIRMGLAESLKAEEPDPAVDELADLLAGGDKKKREKSVSLAQRLLKGRKES
jgi:hypothetical protein